ncbi:hypothetical protein [Prevotella intermedia]|uniref:hypothetical protein n=1 Tax=Prevotella intermedia TaxID=28131 RepID=UPI003FA14250
MRDLRCLQQYHLSIDDASLAADGDISQWCLLLTNSGNLSVFKTYSLIQTAMNIGWR